MKRVAILLFGNLSEALRRRSTRAATSKPYWIAPGQFREFDGRIELIPAMAGDVYTYATRNELQPLGFVVVKDRGEYSEYFNGAPAPEIADSAQERDFALRLFQTSAKYWCCAAPAAAGDQFVN